MELKSLFVTKTVTQTSSKDLEGVGTIRFDADGNMYRWVKNLLATNSTSPAGGLAAYDGTDRTAVTRPATDNLSNMAGVWEAAVVGGSYGWIRVKGKGSITLYRTAANSTQTYGAIDIGAALKGVDDEYHAVSTNAVQAPDTFFMGEALATLASQTTDATHTQVVQTILDFKL